MYAIILAAGYATRLYPLTLDKAKPLLPVRGRPIIDYIIDGLISVPEINKICVVTNDRFYKDFYEWERNLDSAADIAVINDGTKSDDDKLGAIGDIELVINKMKIDDDLIIVAGDNMFGFDLKRFVKFFNDNGLSIASYKYPHKKELSNYGIIELDKNNKVINFQEKPKEPRSNFVAVCLYGFPKDKLKLIKEYIKIGNNKDAPGYYLQWLVSKEEVYSFTFSEPWYDIGTPEAYSRAQAEYEDIIGKRN